MRLLALAATLATGAAGPPPAPSGHRRLTVRVAPLVVDCVPDPG